jgi:hypothetical protein
MFTGRGISKFYIRQMDISAEQYAVRLTGSIAFESSKRKLRTLTAALKEAFFQLKVQKKPSDNSLPNDFVLLVSSIVQEKSNGNNSKTKDDVIKNGAGIFDAQFSNSKDIEKAKSADEKIILQSDSPASTLFTNFSELSKIVSIRFYHEVLGLRFDQDSLVPLNEFLGLPEQTSDTTKSDSNFF